MLHFVDIVEKKVFHLNINTLELDSEQHTEAVTCLALRKDQPGLACATAGGFAVLENGQLRDLVRVVSAEDLRYVRFNDGALDATGHFFAGTVCYRKDGVDIPGRLWRYSVRDGSCLVVDEGPFTDSNGLGWAPDGRTMYFTDSLKYVIYAYDYEHGELSNRRVFVNTLEAGGKEQMFPDGLCIDDQGGVWSAIWGGSKIIRFDPNGKPDSEIHIPSVLRVTACTFGGPNSDQMYITTAHCGAMDGDATKQAQYPDSGHLFHIDLAGKYRGAKWRHHFPG